MSQLIFIRAYDTLTGAGLVLVGGVMLAFEPLPATR